MAYQCGCSPKQWSAPVTDLYSHSTIQQPGKCHVLRTLKTEYPQILKAYFLQDNAGCYPAASTILAVPAMQHSSGVKVTAVDFSDPQGGKGVADRMSATCKNRIWFYINKRNITTVTADEIKAALLSHGRVNGVIVTLVKGQTETSPTFQLSTSTFLLQL